MDYFDFLTCVKNEMAKRGTYTNKQVYSDIELCDEVMFCLGLDTNDFRGMSDFDRMRFGVEFADKYRGWLQDPFGTHKQYEKTVQA